MDFTACDMPPDAGKVKAVYINVFGANDEIYRKIYESPVLTGAFSSTMLWAIAEG